MIDNPISDQVRNFLIDHIDSIAQLEALLLLRQASNESWDTLRLAKRLYIEEAEAQNILSSLVASDFVSTDGTSFHYLIRDDEQQALIATVADAYVRFLVPITKIIHEKTDTVRQFANAFKFRKDN